MARDALFATKILRVRQIALWRTRDKSALVTELPVHPLITPKERGQPHCCRWQGAGKSPSFLAEIKMAGKTQGRSFAPVGLPGAQGSDWCCVGTCRDEKGAPGVRLLWDAQIAVCWSPAGYCHRSIGDNAHTSCRAFPLEMALESNRMSREIGRQMRLCRLPR